MKSPQLIIGYNADDLDYLQYVPNRWYSEKLQMMIQLQPFTEMEITEGIYRGNFSIDASAYDIILHGESTAEDPLPLPNVVKLRRYAKSDQLAILRYLQSKTRSLIPEFKTSSYIVPTFENNRPLRKRQWANFESMVDVLGVVVRPQYGARGLGVHLVPEQRLPQTLDELSSGDWIENFINSTYKVNLPDGANPEQAEKEIKIYREAGFHLVEYVANVRNEYRVIVNGKNEPLIAKRERKVYHNEMGFSKARVPAKGRASEVYGDWTKLAEEDLPLLQAIKAAIGMLKPYVCYGSLDLYTTNTNEFGFFEFSTQFALNAMDNKFRTELVKNMVENMINELKI